MIRSKRKLSGLVAIWALLLFAAPPDIRAQIPPGEQYTEWVRLKCPRLPDSVEAPSVLGHEQMSGECVGKDRARLHYASTHVSTVDAVLFMRGSELHVAGVLVYTPCQSCRSQRTTVYRLTCNKPLSYFRRQDMLQYAEKYGRRSIYTDGRSYETVWSNFIKTIGK